MIQITEEIKKLLTSFSEEEKGDILKTAWDACCDGEYLANGYPSLNHDPWDTGDDETAREIESDAVKGRINLL